MSGRLTFWFLGSVVGTFAAALVPEALFPAVRPIVLGGVLLITGLLGEWVTSRRGRRNSASPRRPRDARLPDGCVEIAPVEGVERKANPHDPRFGRFVSVRKEHPLTHFTDVFPRRPMEGRLCLVSLFVGHDGRGWSDLEVTESHQSLERAGLWFEREAARWSARLNVEIADTYFLDLQTEEDKVAIDFFWEGDGASLVPMDVLAERKALVSATLLASRHGFTDAQQMFREIESRLDADAVVWLLHPRRAGHSLAVCHDASPLDGLTLAVCYGRESNFPAPLKRPPWTDPATVVHEVLHLFGATDKYGRSLSEYDARSVTAREVMRLSETRLSRLRVDPRTALEIGWVDRLVAETPTTGEVPKGPRRSSEVSDTDIEV